MAINTPRAFYRLNSNSNDSSGNLINGTDSNVSYSNPGVIGNCATYNGSSTSYTDLGSTGIIPTTLFSISFFVYIASPSTRQALLGRTDGASQTTSTELFQVSNSNSRKIEVQVNIGSSAYTAVNPSGTTINSNTWYHVGMTWNGTTGNLKLYINGSLERTTTGATGTINNPSSSITRRLGQYGTYTDLPLNGRIDLVGFWNEELSSTDMSNLYNSGNGYDPTSSTPSSNTKFLQFF